jgi:hypothetical protein
LQGSIFYKIAQGVVIWFGIQMLMKQFVTGGKNQPQTVTTTTKDSDGKMVQIPANTADIPAYQLRPAALDEGAIYNRIPQRLAPIWPIDSAVDIVVTVSSSFVPTKVASVPKEMVALKETAFQLGNYSDRRVAETVFDVPTSVQNNGTLWGHFYLGLTGSNLDPKEPGFDPATAVYFTYPLTQYIPKKKESKTRNLLEDKVETVDESEGQVTGPIIANYYHPNTSLSFVPDTGVLNFPQLPPAVQQFLMLEVRLPILPTSFITLTGYSRRALEMAQGRTHGTVSQSHSTMTVTAQTNIPPRPCFVCQPVLANEISYDSPERHSQDASYAT